MPDPLALLKGVKQTLDTLTALRDKIQDAEACNAIADLKMAMADLKEGIVELREENTQLHQEVKRLSQPPQLTKHRGAYIRRSEDGAIVDGPFCSACYEVRGQVVSLTKLGARMVGMTHICPECEAPQNVHPTAKPSQ